MFDYTNSVCSFVFVLLVFWSSFLPQQHPLLLRNNNEIILRSVVVVVFVCPNKKTNDDDENTFVRLYIDFLIFGGGEVSRFFSFFLFKHHDQSVLSRSIDLSFSKTKDLSLFLVHQKTTKNDNNAYLFQSPFKNHLFVFGTTSKSSSSS